MAVAFLRGATLVAVAVVSAWLATAAAEAAEFDCTPSVQPSVDLETSCLAALNTTARRIYGEGRASLEAAADPVLVVGEDLVLHAGGETFHAAHTPVLYTTLKQVSHLALGIFGALIPVTTGAETDDGWRDDLETLAAAGNAVRDEVARLDLPPALIADQLALIDTCLAFIDGQLATEAPDAASLTAFSRAVAPTVLANAALSAAAQVDMIDAAMATWKEQLGEAAMARLYVLVMGPRNPRRDNLFTQYFTRLLGPGSEDRVIYTESVFDEKAALDILGSILIERQVGAAFFGDPARMERDLLADGATVRILEVFGQVPAP